MKETTNHQPSIINHKLLILLLLIISCSSPAQDTTCTFESPDELRVDRLKWVVGSEVGLHTVSLIGLNEIWYKGHDRGPFHFFNDNAEWMQVDKVGHAMTGYYVGRVGKGLLDWSGAPEKHSTWYGGSLGLYFLTSIEILDGFSSEWGASWGDQLANVGGVALFIGQELAWKEQKVVMKYSSHPTKFSNYRSEVLGKSFMERALKDYNGQTYWLSFRMGHILPNSKFPQWFCFSLGYGATGMTGGHENPKWNADGQRLPDFARRRQYYLSLDVDLTAIPTNSRVLKTIFGAFGYLKIPFPALEYNRVDGIKGHPFYF